MQRLVIALFFISTVTALVPIESAAAVPADDSSTNPNDWLPKTRATRWAYLTGLYNCLDNSDFLGFTYRHDDDGKISSGDWWAEPAGPRDRDNEPAGYIGIATKDNGNGKADCNNIVKATMNAYSLTGTELFCELGGKRKDGTDCINSRTSPGFDWPADSGRLDVSKWWGTKNLPSSAGETAYYELNKAAFLDKLGCNANTRGATGTGDDGYTVSIVDDSGQITPTKYIGQKKDHKINVYTSYPDIKSQERTCQQIANDINKYASAFAKWIQGHQESAEENNDVQTGGDTEGATACGVKGIGWIVCPVMTFLADLNDAAFAFLVGFLQIPTIAADGGTSWFDGTLIAWETFRNIANVAFVIVFMVIIYSQLTGAGINNYGIKRLLPKLIIGAILVNISFYLCVAAVEISNVIGTSVVNVFNGLSTEITEAGKNANILDEGAAPSGWNNAITALLKGATGLALVLVIFLAPSVLVVFGIIIFILIARQAAIILLVAIAPLAFVAYLLPNTESLFKRWWKVFSTLLMVFPIIALVFGASTLASAIVGNIAVGDDSQMLALMALGIQAVPLFAVPVLLKGAMAAAGTIGQRLSGYADKAQGRATSQGKQRYGDTALGRGRALKKQGKQEYRNRQFARGVSGDDKSLLGRARGRMARGALTNGRTLRPDGAASFAQERLETLAQAQVEKAEREQVETAKAEMAGHDWGKLQSVASDKNTTAAHRRAAMEKLAEQGAVKELGILRATADNDEFGQSVRRYSGSVAGKAPDLVTDASPAAVFGGASTEAVSGWHASTLERALSEPTSGAATRATFEAAITDPRLVSKISDDHYKAYKNNGGTYAAVAHVPGMTQAKWNSLR